MQKINKNDVYDHNLNFLIGSGASFGLIPTLALNLKNSESGGRNSIETLATKFEDISGIKALLFSWYVKEVIKPASEFDIENEFLFSLDQSKVLENYERFLASILAMLSRKSNQSRANIFTTNYDGLIAHVSEKMLQKGDVDFVLNDGGSGFVKRVLNTKNFNRFYRDQGVFDQHSKNVPQINLLQLHGSVYWYKDGENIEISYDLDRAKKRISDVPVFENREFDALLSNCEKNDADVRSFTHGITTDQTDLFWEQYNQLPVVNPTKWKFHETVFEEHYYQMLRLLSYELEKPNSIFIVFGFSFANEHILNLVKRSLSNPTLKFFVCCFDKQTKAEIGKKFAGFTNVELIELGDNLDFSAFNDRVFNSNSKTGIADQ